MINDFVFYAFFILVFLILTFNWLFYMFDTDRFLSFGLKVCRTYCGMKVSYISRKCGTGLWCYAEKGSVKLKHRHHGHHNHHRNNHSHKHAQNKHQSKPTLVFLHGFGGDKDTWPSMVKYIPSYYHCVMVDMPGHGETSFVDGVDEPNVEGFVKALREFLEVTGLDQSKITLIGCSYGGAIAGLFSFYYPELIDSLILLCPAIRTPILTEHCKLLMDGEFNLLIPENGSQFIRMISLLCSTKQYYPKRIMQSFVNINFYPERQILLKKILKNLVTDDLEKFDDDITGKLSSIQAQTLIIWGKEDQMLHYSGGEFLNQCIKNSQLKVIENCNHVLQLDQPKVTTQLMLEFLASF